MCGIVGHVTGVAFGGAQHRRIMTDMLSQIRHRGPDDCGLWDDPEQGVALGHRRLSVVDLSPAGHQPMSSTDGRYVVVFNGEIYNHRELRAKVEKDPGFHAVPWRGHSDTETLLACICCWGIDAALRASVGMFALALWDRRERSLWLARDRLGEKPLYYGWQGDSFLFASELKAMRQHPHFQPATDWSAAEAFLRYNHVPAPHSIQRGIHKLLPGTWMRLSAREIGRRESGTPTPYWSIGEAALAGAREPFVGTFDAAVDRLEQLLRDAVQLQSMADVPVGAFLSGGIDSSAVVAMMRSATNAEVTTFAIGMPEVGMDESKHAAQVAQHLGTCHVEHRVQPREALDLIPSLSRIWDEPLGDSSQIPTYIVSRIARRHVTVALSGDGGDELFLGYAQYPLYQSLWRTRALRCLPWQSGIDALSTIAGTGRVRSALRRADAVVHAWQQPDGGALARYWMDRYRQRPVPLATQEPVSPREFPVLREAATTAALWDAGTYLPDDVLVKVDRASMANSLETRAPLLDHRIVEFAYSLPFDYKMHAHQQKRALRALLYRHVPQAIVDRPKMGFSIPMGLWLRTELRSWAEGLLADLKYQSTPFDTAAIRRLWEEHQHGRRDHTERLWGVLSLAQFTHTC